MRFLPQTQSLAGRIEVDISHPATRRKSYLTEHQNVYDDRVPSAYFRLTRRKSRAASLLRTPVTHKLKSSLNSP